MKASLIPLLLLAGILTASILNCQTMETRTDRWREQLEAAETQAEEQNWSAVEKTLAQSYEDWSRHQTYLHVVAEHDAVDGAEAMYRRCAAFAATQEPSEFRAESADLRHQLCLLAEMERFSVKNIL